MARKVPKTVSPQFAGILTLVQVMVVLSVYYLVDWYYFQRPMQSWVLELAWSAFVAGIVFAIALRIVPRLRRQVTILRFQFRALPPSRQSVAKMFSALIGTCGFTGPELIWYLIPQGADHSRPPGYDLAVFGFAAVEAALFLASIKFISRT